MEFLFLSVIVIKLSIQLSYYNRGDLLMTKELYFF